MLYIVSGFMRSGTSMMMKALEAGGLEAAHAKERDVQMNERWGGVEKYYPNEEYYELNRTDYADENFPLAHDGKLIKCLWVGIPRIKPCEARLIVMRRNREEILRSLIASFGHADSMVQGERFDSLLERVVAIAKDRRSFITVDEIWYGDVLEDPLSVFTNLKANGWPIDPEKAAAIPDKGRKRHKVS